METLELVKKCQAGDTSAFGELYDLFADRIFRYIRLKVRDHQQAEEILQDVFTKAWLGIQKLSLKDLNFSAWLYKVAGNTINDYFRKLYRSPEISELTADMPVAATDDATSAITAAYDAQTLLAGLKELPTQYRQILELRFIQDFTIKETADILGKSNLAVRLAQHRALKQLKEIMKKDEPLEATDGIGN